MTQAEIIAQKFDRLYVDQVSADTEIAGRLMSFFDPQKIELVSERPFHTDNRRLSKDEFDRSKKNLFLTPFKGHFFKRCPGSKPGLACCNYFVLNWGLQCDFNCSYCYLQSFLNTPVTTLYSNLKDALVELDELVPELSQSTLRVGTGEVVDSLSLDPLTLFSRDLIEYFSKVPNWQLEFKTKSSYVDQFLDVPHQGNVIVSWSINPSFIVDTEEHLTASLNDRLAAARKVQSRGFKLAFHIDPVIWHPEWEQNYGELVDLIIQQFSPDQVAYLSIGGLRYQKEQRHMMRERFTAKSWSLRGEMFPSSDGKLRYDFDLRNRMFDFILKRFKAHSKAWKIFLCMETPETWLSTAGENPFKSNELQDLFSPKILNQVKKNEPTAPIL